MLMDSEYHRQLVFVMNNKAMVVVRNFSTSIKVLIYELMIDSFSST